MNSRYLLIFSFLTYSIGLFGRLEEQLISFHYDNENLANVVNFIASKKDINLLFPTRADEKLESKLTWHLDKKVTLDEAWELLQTILAIAGYSLVKKPTYYEIVKNSATITRETFPLYVGVPAEALPLSDEYIRYLYAIINHKAESEADPDNEIATVLKSMLPPDATFKIDPASNTLLLTGRSNDLRSVMAIVSYLDRPGFQERMEIIKLNYTQARMVADLFNSKILQGSDVNRYHLDSKKPSETIYFPRHVKIIANDRTNSLIVLGRMQAIERIRHFINQYIDVEPDSGKSILHIYKLQYLDAPSFADVLRKIVASKVEGGVEQSTGEKKGTTGPLRYFDEVIIEVDTPKTSEDPFANTASADSSTGPAIKAAKYYGGNNLIIAARADDWKKIRELIEKLDQPSPQVLIEVLIADLTLDDNRALGSFFRNPAKLPMPGQINFQSAPMGPPGVLPDSFSNPETIGFVAPAGPSSDLLREFTPSNPNTTPPTPPSDTPSVTTANLVTPGTTVISMSDNSGATWGITQILKLIDNTRILSHPHVISTNNQLAVIKSTETRVLVDQASGSQGGTIVSTNKNIPASLSVNIIPRISFSETRESTVNLQVVVDINEYTSGATSATNGTRNTRNVTTNATVNSGDILALGGLIRSNDTDSVTETPILSQIPLIGWFFKNRSKTIERTNLTVFISPTIIQPRLRGGIGVYTQDYIAITKNYAGDDSTLFGTLKDPITRFFFNEKSPTELFTKEFMARDEIHSNNQNEVPDIPKKAGTGEVSRPSVPVDKVSDLKELLKDIDNPFEKVKTEQVTQARPAEKSRRKRA